MKRFQHARRRRISQFKKTPFTRPWYLLTPTERMNRFIEKNNATRLELKASNPFVDAGIQAMDILVRNGEAANVQKLSDEENVKVQECTEGPTGNDLPIQPDSAEISQESGEEGTK